MNAQSARPRRPRQPAVPSGLPDDDDDALARLAEAAFAPQAAPAGGARRALSVAVAAPVLSAGAASDASHISGVPAEQPPADPADQAARREVDLAREAAQSSAGDPTRDYIRQATIGVDAQVAARFRDYQRREAARTGVKPSNLEVIFAALRAADGRYVEIVESRRPRVPDGQRWGRPVPGRRTGAPRLPSQINYRPSVGELADITQLAADAGADSVSAFLNMLLDEFLPKARSRTAPQP